MPADWGTFMEGLREKLVREGRVSMTTDEISAATDCHDSAVRERWFWRAGQLGSKDYEGFAEAGMRLEFFPDERGRDVETVTFFYR